MDITRDGAGLTVRAPAKLNLFLEVLRKRPDGYHDIETVMQTVSLFDELHLALGAGGIRFSTDAADVPADRTNLVVLAAELLREHARCDAGATIRLTKRIPVGAGMGGGSSDAAGALVGLNRLWKLDLPREELHPLAARIGSDVPFFLYGGTAVCRGRGDVVEPVPDAPDGRYVVVYPGIHLSTRQVYENLPPGLTTDACVIKLFLSQLINRKRSANDLRLYNRLESVAVGLVESLSHLRTRMEEGGLANVTMTGSGSAFFGMVPEDKEVRRIVEELTRGDVGEVFAVESIH